MANSKISLKVTKQCEKCLKHYKVHKYRENTARFCCHICYSDSLKKQKILKTKKEKITKQCPICLKQFFVRPSRIEFRKYCSYACRARYYSGPLSPHWKKDRTKLSKKQERNDMYYKEWRRSIWERDKFKCRVSDKDCSGRIEAHHILSWSEYPELRYKINNGITLCHAHHPRKRAEEKRLVPRFQELVSVSN